MARARGRKAKARGHFRNRDKPTNPYGRHRGKGHKIRYLALMDEFGRELTYYGYSRQRYVEQPGWSIIDFSPYEGDKPLVLAGAWITDSPTSRMRDGEWFPCVGVIDPGQKINIHINVPDYIIDRKADA